MATATEKVLSHLLKDDYISVILKTKEGVLPFQLTPSHPTFSQLHKALSKGNMQRVPALVTLARAIANKTQGRVAFTKNGITFRGHEVPGVISRLAARTLKETGSASDWLKFVENLYKNPEKRSREELVEFLEKAEAAKYPVPITDDGCFLGYKAVNSNYTDCHTGTIDNSVGALRQMPRKAVDPDRRNECSRGFHFCSLGYLSSFGGGKIMAVKINPKDIVAIPKDYNFSKGRTWKYEVIYELADKTDETSTTHNPIMAQAVVPVYAELKELRAKLLEIPAVKRAIRRGKMKLSTINKQNRGQVEKLYLRFAKMAVTAPDQSKVLGNSLMDTRNAAGLTIGEVAKELDITYKAVWALEHSDNPRQEAVDNVLEAIAKLKHGGKRDGAITGFGGGKEVVTAGRAAAAAASLTQGRFNDYGSYVPPSDEVDAEEENWNDGDDYGYGND
jgi:hypothetical protein